MSNFDIAWIDGGRTAQNPPDPAYPNGIELDISRDAKVACLVELTYPAPRVGQYSIMCRDCGFHALVTAAGRADDPKSIKVPCRTRR